MASIFRFLLTLYLSYNLNGGATLKLTDGSTWQIHPDDTIKTSMWITPLEIKVSPSQDPNYPYFLENSLTHEKVRAKSESNAPQN